MTDRYGISPRHCEDCKTATETARVESWEGDYLIPLAPDVRLSLQGRFPLSERQWQTFMNVLQAMRPGLVAPDFLVTLSPEGPME